MFKKGDERGNKSGLRRGKLPYEPEGTSWPALTLALGLASHLHLSPWRRSRVIDG